MQEHVAGAHRQGAQRGHQPGWQDHRVGLGRQDCAVGRFLLTAIYYAKLMTNFGSETFPHNLPTRASVWDLATGECKSTLQGHTAQVLSVAVSSDGKTVVSGSCDNSVR